MSVIDSIREWADTQAPWLKLATKKLLNQESLTNDDKTEIYSLFRGDIAETANAQITEVVPVAGGTIGKKYSLVEIRNPQNVNALAEDQTLSFSKEGVTVVFGENGSGKTGYSRILKNACQSRDSMEEILQNVFNEPAMGSVPQAVIRVCIDDQEEDVMWSPAIPPNMSLKKIAVFDAHCARFYIEKQTDVIFQPYGLDIFDKLVQLCVEIKTALVSEQNVLEKVQSPLVHFPQDSKVRDEILTLSVDSAVSSIISNNPFSQREEQRVAELEVMVATIRHSDSKSRIESLGRFSERIDRLLRQIAEIQNALGSIRVDNANIVFAECIAAKKAAGIVSSSQFLSEPLPEVGGDIWKAMFIAAKEYSEKAAYRGIVFPNISDGSLCPLCQQSLSSDAKDRLQRFTEYLQDRTQEAAREKENIFRGIMQYILSAPMDGDLADDLFINEIISWDVSVASMLSVYRNAAQARYIAIKDAAVNGKFLECPVLGEDPSQNLSNIRIQVNETAGELEKNSRVEELVKIERELTELYARKKLNEVSAELSEYIMAQRNIQNIKRMIAMTDTTAISRKASKVTEGAVTETLGRALERELQTLNIGQYEFALEKKARAGITYHQLRMKMKMRDVPDLSRVLSEGEQNIVSIASFLAELSTAEDVCGVVFDDPVSSLDHRWRERIARRLAAEGKNRQVVILTHDVYFLLELVEQCNENQTPINSLAMVKDGEKAGVISAELPWVAMKVGERVRCLEEMVSEVEALCRANEYKRGRQVEERFYDLLRSTWERSIEEVIFYSTVLRFRMSVETRRLRRVVLDDVDYVTITNNMSVTSRRTPAHDTAGAIGTIAPDANEMRARIRAFVDYMATIRAKQNEVETRRSAMV